MINFDFLGGGGEQSPTLRTPMFIPNFSFRIRVYLVILEGRLSSTLN